MRKIYKFSKGRFTIFLEPESIKWSVATGEYNIDDITRVFEDNGTAESSNYLESDELSLVGISVLPTFGCNLNCIHCFYESSPKKNEISLKKDDISKIINIIMNFNIQNVTIGGGEPLTWCYFEELITSILQNTKANVFLLTNGLLLNRIANTLKDYRNRINVQVSLDACTPERYSIVRQGDFHRVVDNIALLCKEGVKVSLSFTLHKYNHDQFIPFIKFCEVLGVGSLHFPILESFGRAQKNSIGLSKKMLLNYYLFLVYYSFRIKNLEIFFVEEIKQRLINRIIRKNCVAGFRQVALGPDGYIYPCSELIQSNFKICELNNFDKLYEYLEDFRLKYGFGTPVVDRLCPDCHVKYLCGGGCRAVSMLKGGSYFDAMQSPVVCEILKNATLAVILEIASERMKGLSDPAEIYNNGVLELVREYERCIV